MAGDFFLDADDAKSLGNAEYMRQRTKTRRTFPKGLGTEKLEIVQEVSSIEMKVTKNQNGLVTQSESKLNGTPISSTPTTNGFRAPIVSPAPITPVSVEVNGQAASSPNAEATSEPTAPNSTDVRRSSDNSMDMFRSMARQIRKP